VPAAARDVYDRSRTFRRHIGALDLIVAVWNRIQNTILPVELPLVRPQIEELHTRLDDGLRALDWNSAAIDKYIDEVKVQRLQRAFIAVRVLRCDWSYVTCRVCMWLQEARA
jgi:Dynein heavy chain, N-terminal region 1